MKMINFPSIESFRKIISTVKKHASYKGLDDEGKAIYDPWAEAPSIDFVGTVKLHGTNAGIAMLGDELWAQSKNNILNIDKDNAGFAFFVEGNKECFRNILSTIRIKNNVPDECTLVLYGEWCGKGIQKGVAISELDKMFVAFKIKVVIPDEERANYWLDLNESLDFSTSWGHEMNARKIFSIFQFPTYKMRIDFNKPEESQNKLVALTVAVENECPVGRHFDVSGVGEGIVWTAGELIFKVKGEKHSVTKVKKLASVDIEKVNSIQEFVEYAVTENRLLQAVGEVFTSQGIEISKREIGSFVGWVNRDIIKEEIDTMTENGLAPKEVGSLISKKAVKWLITQYGL